MKSKIKIFSITLLSIFMVVGCQVNSAKKNNKTMDKKIQQNILELTRKVQDQQYKLQNIRAINNAEPPIAPQLNNKVVYSSWVGDALIYLNRVAKQSGKKLLISGRTRPLPISLQSEDYYNLTEILNRVNAQTKYLATVTQDNKAIMVDFIPQK